MKKLSVLSVNCECISLRLWTQNILLEQNDYLSFVKRSNISGQRNVIILNETIVTYG